MIARRSLILAGTAALAACASGESWTSVSQRVPPPSRGAGRLWVYRAGEPLALAMRPDVLIDGQVAGRAVAGGFFYRDVGPGIHVVTTSSDPDRPLSLPISPGEEKYVRIGVSFGLERGHIVPALADPLQARAEIRSLSYVGA
jgi:hypothetical protein